MNQKKSNNKAIINNQDSEGWNRFDKITARNIPYQFI